jgi:hypothetical protein
LYHILRAYGIGDSRSGEEIFAKLYKADMLLLTLEECAGEGSQCGFSGNK